MAAPVIDRAAEGVPGIAPADPATEGAIASDLVKRAALVAPLVVVVAAAWRGTDGAASAGFAVGLVALNFVLAAASLAWAARISPGIYLGTALGGYLVRLGIITAAVLAVRNLGWVDLPTLGLTLVSSHLGLLGWELRYVSLSFAAPGLRPARAPAPAPTKTTENEGASL